MFSFLVLISYVQLTKAEHSKYHSVNPCAVCVEEVPSLNDKRS